MYMSTLSGRVPFKDSFKGTSRGYRPDMRAILGYIGSILQGPADVPTSWSHLPNDHVFHREDIPNYLGLSLGRTLRLYKNLHFRGFGPKDHVVLGFWAFLSSREY